MKKSFDLKILENTDRETVEEISEYPSVTGSERKKLYRELSARSSINNSDYAEQVGGVEVIRRSHWHRKMCAAAAMTALVLGISGTFYALRKGEPKNSGKTSPTKENSLMSEIATPESPSESGKAQRVPKDYDMSTQEGVYFKMLNSIDYFDRVSGELIDCTIGLPYCGIVEFESDLTTSKSYSHYMLYSINDPEEAAEGGEPDIVPWTEPDGFIELIEYCDGIHHHIFDVDSGGYSFDQKVYSRFEDATYKDENRHTVDNDGNDIWQIRSDVCNVRKAHMCLSPQEITFGFLTDFDSWCIEGTQEHLGRECIVIHGTLSGKHSNNPDVSDFEFYVDKQTGTLLKYIGRNKSGGISEFLYVRSIAFDDDAANVREVDISEWEGAE